MGTVNRDVQPLFNHHQPSRDHRYLSGHQQPQHVITALAHWLKPENRCIVSANSFAEYAPETNPVTKKDGVWFALNEAHCL